MIRSKPHASPAVPVLHAQGASDKTILVRDIAKRVKAHLGDHLATEELISLGKRFGHDFSKVRIHHGPEARALTHSVRASAFTLGSNVVLGEDEFPVNSHVGRRRLAHELAHVVQQSGSTFESEGQVARNDPRESEAARVADRVVAGQSAGPLLHSPIALACDEPVSGQEEEITSSQDEPVDVHAGKMVRRIIIDLNRGRVGFELGTEMVRGSVSTDLKPGNYLVRPDFTEHDWVFRTGDEGEPSSKEPSPSVKSGQRFQVELEGALPSTLSYPDKIPLVVGISTDSAKPENDADLVRFFDELELEKKQEADDPTVDGYVDFEYTPTWETDGKTGQYSDKVTLIFLDGSRLQIDLGEIEEGTMSDDERVEAITNASVASNGRVRPKVLNASTAPNLVAMKRMVRARQRWLKEHGETDSLNMQITSFPVVFSLLTINPLTMAQPLSSTRGLARSPLPRTPLIARGGTKMSPSPASASKTPSVTTAGKAPKPPSGEEYAAIKASEAGTALKIANRLHENPATIYNHEVRRGGLGSIAASQELRAGGGTSAFGGGDAVRAHFGPAKHVDKFPVVEFRTAVRGSARPFPEGVGANWSSGLKDSPIDGSLKIEILRIRFPDGRIATPLSGGRYQVRSPNGDLSVVDATTLGM